MQDLGDELAGRKLPLFAEVDGLPLIP